MSLISFPAVTLPAEGPVKWRLPRHEKVTAYQRPQLLYHVQVARGQELVPEKGKTFPAFHNALPNWGPRLTTIYGMYDATVQFIPRERAPDHVGPLREGPQACGDGLAQIDTRVIGCSWNLAGAIGVAAALLEKPVPAWVCSSGCLPSNKDFDSSLALGETGLYESKIRLCGGQSPDYDADHRGKWLCQGPAVCEMHGEKEHRGLPGQIRLLLLARWEPDGYNSNGLPDQVREELGLVSLPELVDTIAENGLNKAIDSLAAKEMLVLQVPTVWHALKVLSLHVSRFPADIHISPAEITAFLAPRDIDPRTG